MGNVIRRDFLKSIAVAGAGATVARAGAPQETGAAPAVPRPSTGRSVIVAGGGLAGLCCAYELMKRGHEVVVLEAQGRHGGRVLSVHDGLADGLYADFGAEHFHKRGYERLWAYVKELDLAVLPYPHRVNRLTRENGTFYTEATLTDLRHRRARELGGFNKRELAYLSSHPLSSLASLYLDPYLDRFTDGYQPFGVGYDHLDEVPMAEIYKKDGASAAALDLLGGQKTSALFEIWRAYILSTRGNPSAPSTESYRLEGGNDRLTQAFAKRLGTRVMLGCRVLEIAQGQSGVTVSYDDCGERKEISADFVASCLPSPAFATIQVSPAWSEEKRFVLEHLRYAQSTRIVFQARSPFWVKDGVSINIVFNHPELNVIWQVAEEVETERVALMAKAPGSVPAARALKVFKSLYPGDASKVSIEHAVAKDWCTDPFALGCERLPFPIGTLKKFWPHVMAPHGRIHFAGGYADNNSWGMEAAINSAHRVAKEIDQA